MDRDGRPKVKAPRSSWSDRSSATERLERVDVLVVRLHGWVARVWGRSKDTLHAGWLQVDDANDDPALAERRVRVGVTATTTDRGAVEAVPMGTVARELSALAARSDDVANDWPGRTGSEEQEAQHESHNVSALHRGDLPSSSGSARPFSETTFDVGIARGRAVTTACPPHSDEWLMVAKREVPGDLNDLYRGPTSRTTSAALCSNCGRLWVAWRNEDPVIEYVPIDHPAPGVDRDSGLPKR
jgi:hypothetical protein